jgi:hypothetical protein
VFLVGLRFLLSDGSFTLLLGTHFRECALLGERV